MAFERGNHLVDQICLAFRGGLHHPQMPWLDPEPPQFGDERGDSDRLRVVRPVGERHDQPVRLPLLEFLFADPGGREQLGTADPDGGGPLGLQNRLAVPLPADGGQRYGLPRSMASRYSLITFSGR